MHACAAFCHTLTKFNVVYACNDNNEVLWNKVSFECFYLVLQN